MLKEFLYSSSINVWLSYDYISSLLVGLIAFFSTSLNFNREHVLTFSVICFLLCMFTMNSRCSLLKIAFYTRMIKCLIVHCSFLLLFLIFTFFPHFLYVLLLVCYARQSQKNIEGYSVRYSTTRSLYWQKSSKRAKQSPIFLDLFWSKFVANNIPSVDQLSSPHQQWTCFIVSEKAQSA